MSRRTITAIVGPTAALVVAACAFAAPATANAAGTTPPPTAPAPAARAVGVHDAGRVSAKTSITDLTEEQRNNARTIIRVAEESSAIDPSGKDNAIHSALMAAMQESSLRSLNYGDADSVGLFQQRPSQGWGSVEQIMDPVFAAQSFYGINSWGSNPGVIQQKGWQTMDPGVLAQAVQRSAYPDRYAQWYDLSVQLLNDYRTNPA